MKKASRNPREFDYGRNYRRLDLRRQPSLYRVGRGEQGVLLVEPYKSELLPHWRFRTPADARESAREILAIFRRYVEEGDFVGMDMARKFLQMGYTRSRRYANHRTGKKYDGPVPRELRGKSGAHGRKKLPADPDPVKAESAEIFFEAWKRVENNAVYARLKREWKEKLG